ncbi:MAG: molybdopterin cofactor-binding domain-containing protein [Cyclobacteriaceae bacterium]
MEIKIGNKISRRKFVGLTGGLTFAVSVGGFAIANSKKKATNPLKFNAWVRVMPDDTIIIYNPAAEMGQGSSTALPVILAEEMDADWSKVVIEDSPIDRPTYGHDVWGMGPWMGIVGSIAVAGYFDRLRIAGAQAKKVLKWNAAQQWEVPIEELTTSNNSVIHSKSARRVSYGEIAEFGTVPNPVPEATPNELKSPTDFKLIGSEILRRDIPEKSNGLALYSMDIKLENMVYGAIKHAPVNGAKPLNISNEVEVLNRNGVIKIIKLEYAVAVVATSIEIALIAKDELEISWSEAPADSFNSENFIDDYPKILDDPDVETKEKFRSGEVNPNGVIKSFKAEFFNDYIYHSQMEPLNAVVSQSSDKKSAEIWVGTQAPDSALRDAAKTLGLEESGVKLNRCYLGGGFGRRASRDYLIEACQIAKQIDQPLKVIWSREDDVQQGMFRPAMLQRIEAGIDKNSKIINWKYQVTGAGGGLISTGSEMPFYDIPNQFITEKRLDHGIRLRSWRAEGHGANKYAIEAFIDEIAAELKVDSLEFRRQHITNARALGVLKTVEKMSEWPGKAASGRAYGLSFCERDSITACVCEVSVKDSGEIRVHKVWMAVDAGIVVQPNNAKAQIEGAIIMGISSSLKERITFKNGEVQQSNFHDYQILRCSEAPEVLEVKFIPSEEPPTGIGEAGVPAIGGAIANAFAKLTGKRLYHMPFTRERVREVLG